uniref:Uncharacterized protein n=1 Tax=Anguilla anguilla TaxID=7936 RepID=A0A0E9V166_ANGAN
MRVKVFDWNLPFWGS